MIAFPKEAAEFEKEFLEILVNKEFQETLETMELNSKIGRSGNLESAKSRYPITIMGVLKYFEDIIDAQVWRYPNEENSGRTYMSYMIHYLDFFIGSYLSILEKFPQAKSFAIFINQDNLQPYNMSYTKIEKFLPSGLKRML